MSDDAEITPDAKDWTWVIDRTCPECGFVAGRVGVVDVAPLVRGGVTRWREVLSSPGVAERPRPDVWSPLEYACHVRDVHALFAERLGLILGEHDPLFASWDQDATAVAEAYREQDPAEVATGLAASAEEAATRFAAVPGDAHGRTGRRSDGARFTVVTFARYYVHDPLHHVWDVTGVPATVQVARDLTGSA